MLQTAYGEVGYARPLSCCNCFPLYRWLQMSLSPVHWIIVDKQNAQRLIGHKAAPSHAVRRLVSVAVPVPLGVLAGDVIDSFGIIVYAHAVDDLQREGREGRMRNSALL